ncbi:MAG: hypothetical protein LQ337_007226 [Flavoplaca oasis]|nr:MAG: hypothetical protein LQ337_007226 [Flavoplaca oasis]
MTTSRPARRAGTGRPRSARPKTRNLIRWTDELDKKLLLTIQWACNVKGIKLPWDLVATEISRGLSSSTTDSAIIQHLAKFRIRMVQQGLSVPPPLTRGGSNNPPAAHVGQGSTAAAPTNAGSARRNTKSTGRKSKSKQEVDSDEETAEETASNSEMEMPKKSSAKAKGKQKTDRASRGRGVKPSKENQQVDDSDFEVVKEEPTSSIEGRDSQPRYGVGDTMWSLDGMEEAPAKRARASMQSNQASRSPSKVVVLDIGRKGFAKLGVTSQAEHFELRDDVSDGQSDVSDRFSNNDSSEDHAFYNGEVASASSDNHHNPYGRKTLGPNQKETSMGGHDGFEEGLGQVTLYDEHRFNAISEGVGLPPALFSRSYSKSHGNHGQAGHGLPGSPRMAGLPERFSSNASVDGHFPKTAATYNGSHGTHAACPNGGATFSNLHFGDKTSLPDDSQYGLLTSNDGHQSSISSYDSYHTIGGEFAGLPDTNYGNPSETPCAMSRVSSGLDYMASGADYNPGEGTDWNSFLHSEQFGFGY